MTLDVPVIAGSVTVSVDGREVRVPRGATLLDAALAAGVDLPHLCKPEARGPLGACRTCLVEVEGAPRLAAACHTPVAEGQAIRTNSQK
ncbi:MAG: 2Fe-2S iron-sulfur cluster-binding protein, partial [Dehalococcoidia bacterium]